MEEASAARIAPVVPVVVRPEPIASAVVISRAAARVTGMPSAVVPGDSMDPMRAVTAIVASPVWDLAVEASIAVAASIVAAVASVVVAAAAVVEVSEVVVEAAGVAAVVAVAGKRYESDYEITGARI